MQEIVRIVSENPLAAIGVVFAVLLILYFLFMNLVKMALILLLIAVAVGGYFYFQYPENRPANLKEAVEKARTGTGRPWKKGRKPSKRAGNWSTREKRFTKRARRSSRRARRLWKKGSIKEKSRREERRR